MQRTRGKVLQKAFTIITHSMSRSEDGGGEQTQQSQDDTDQPDNMETDTSGYISRRYFRGDSLIPGTDVSHREAVVESVTNQMINFQVLILHL